MNGHSCQYEVGTPDEYQGIGQGRSPLVSKVPTVHVQMLSSPCMKSGNRSRAANRSKPAPRTIDASVSPSTLLITAVVGAMSTAGRDLRETRAATPTEARINGAA